MKRLAWAIPIMVLGLAGCTTWKPTTISPRQLIQQVQPDRIRVLRTDGTHVDIREPWLEVDSLAGIVRGRRVVQAAGNTGRRRNMAFVDTVRVALSDITVVETRGPSGVRTVALIGVIGVVGFGAFVAAFLLTYEGN